MNARRRKQIATYAVAAMLGGQLMSPRAFAANENDKRQDESRHHREYRTETPIKHVIVLIGENRTFDNIYGTYVPKHGAERLESAFERDRQRRRLAGTEPGAR